MDINPHRGTINVDTEATGPTKCPPEHISNSAFSRKCSCMDAKLGHYVDSHRQHSDLMYSQFILLLEAY